MTYRRLLVVDDDLDTRTVLHDFFTSRGYEVWTARTGRSALQLLGDDPGFDAVLMDLRMPEMTGEQILTTMQRSKGSLRHLPVIVVSAFAERFSVTIQVGNRTYPSFTKPIALEGLHKKVLQLIGPSGPNRA